MKKMTTSTSKITKRERYESIMALCDTLGTMDGFDLDGIMEFCQKEIDTLGARAEKAKERAAAKRAEGDELQAAVLAALTDEFATRDEITARIEGDEVTLGKVGYRLTQLVKNGDAIKDEMTVAGENGKNRRVTVYKLA